MLATPPGRTSGTARALGATDGGSEAGAGLVGTFALTAPLLMAHCHRDGQGSGALTDHTNASDQDSSEAPPEGRSRNQLPITDPDAYRETMGRFTREATAMISGILSDADFKSDFPHIFGHPDEFGAEVNLQNHCGLFLKKALLHGAGAIAADQSGNLHSLAVQLRVVLECAGPVLSWAHLAGSKNSRHFKRILNITEYDITSTLKGLLGSGFDVDDLQPSILGARQQIGVQRQGRPKRVTIADKVEALAGGVNWYNFLSEHFCKVDPDALDRPSVLGGVVRPPREIEAAAFGFFLAYLADLLIQMAAGYGLIATTPSEDSRPFDDAIALLERKREAEYSFVAGQTARSEPHGEPPMPREAR